MIDWGDDHDMVNDVPPSLLLLRVSDQNMAIRHVRYQVLMMTMMVLENALHRREEEENVIGINLRAIKGM